MKRPSGSSRRSRSSRGLRGLAGSKEHHEDRAKYAARLARSFALEGKCGLAFVTWGEARAHQMESGKRIPSVDDSAREVYARCEANERR